MKRIEYKGPEAPSHVKQTLRRLGGDNFYGMPNYRLVEGGHRLAPSGGRWFSWNNSLSVGERKEGVSNPIRTEVEVRMVPRYPGQGGKWILEKWCSPESYGTPEGWYLPTTSGGTMMFIPEELRYIPCLGEYPDHGDYENLGYAFPLEAVTVAVMELAVGRLEQGLAQMPMTPKARVARATYQAEEIEAQTRDAHKRFCLDVLDETDYAFKGSQFMSMSGAKRSHSMNADAIKAGVRSHTGRS